MLVDQQVIDNVSTRPDRRGKLYGRFHTEDDLVQVLTTSSDRGLDHIGWWVKDDNSTRGEEETRRHIAELATGHILLEFQEKKSALGPIGYIRQPTGNHSPVQVERFTMAAALNRLHGALDPSLLSKKKVLMVGLGSGGSHVALELAKSGVPNIVLVDSDRLDIDNIVRHTCGFDDIGRLKTRAVRDALLNHNPQVHVECHELDVRANLDIFKELILQSDLVVAATGSPSINSLTNELCVEARTPAIFAGVWEKASGGFVMRYLPGRTACFNCVHEFLLSITPPKETRTIDYSVIDDLSELKAEPGLSVDIGFIALLQAKLSLHVLVEESKEIEEISHHLLIWLNRRLGDYGNLTILKANVKRRDNCVICNQTAKLSTRLP